MNQREKKILLGIIIAFIVVYAYANGLVPLSLISNYQGPKPEFYAIRYNNVLYTRDDCHGASTCVVDVQLNFDPDEPYTGMGNIAGEMTSIVVPKDVDELLSIEWIPRDWLKDYKYLQNPVNEYVWKIETEDGYIAYKMEEWRLKWFVTISYEPDTPEEGVEKILGGLFVKPKRYHNVEIWFRIDLNNIQWYFEGANDTYFGIAKIQLHNIKIDALDTGKVRVIPMSSGSYLPLFDNVNGEQIPNPTPYEYQGKKLNPEVFKKEVYTRIILEDFGSQLKEELIGYTEKDDAITMELDVYVFVVGEWKVKDIQNFDAEIYGRHAKVTTYGVSLDPILAWFSNPFNLGLLGLFMVLVILIILAIFAPGVLTLISSAASRLSQRVRKK